MPQTLQAFVEDRQRKIAFGATTLPMDDAAMERARQTQPSLRPVTLGLAPSFGFGDRTGLATPGHVQALKRSGGRIKPIFPQQSIREMSRTARTPRQVMDEALFGMLQAGYTGPTGADADHLKTPADIEATASVGFTFFTIDPSGEVDPGADQYSESVLRGKFVAIKGEIPWFDNYLGRSIRLSSGSTIQLDEQACMRAAVKYGRAINRAVELASHIAKVNQAAGQDYEIELSVDETDQPTTLAEHFIIADQCLSGGMKLVSLAPRYVGDFEKGVDFKGDLGRLERSMLDHTAIAAMLGPYKLSLHSGSDKLSIYRPFARATRGMFHVKTAGTSYLEALRVVARHDEALFRRIIDFSRGRYMTDRATYHVSATLEGVPPSEAVSDPHKLEQLYLECWEDVPEGRGFTAPGRQILHCTFGSVLLDPTLGPALQDILQSHGETYTQVLAEHFARHLRALESGMP